LTETRTTIETKAEVLSYLQNLRYALEHNAKTTFQIERFVDRQRNQRYTNRYTVADLFPNENPVTVVNYPPLRFHPES